MKQHIWQGQWIDDEELRKKIPSLGKEVPKALLRGLDIKVLIKALKKLGERLGPGQRLYKKLYECVKQTHTISNKEIKSNLRTIIEFIKPEAIEEKLRRELGSIDPFDIKRVHFNAHVFESWAPLGFLVHVTPTNVFLVGALSLIEGLLCGNVNFIKTGGSDSLFTQTFAKALIDCDDSGTLKKFIYAARISSGQTDLLKKIFSGADGISVWGSDQAVQGVKSLSPASARIIPWGHKISFAYIAAECVNDRSILEPLARECCLLEQQACSSPQCVYVETANEKELIEFGNRFSRTLNRVSKAMPGIKPNTREQAEITTVTQLARLESVSGGTKVIESKNKDWRILIENKANLKPSPLFRTIWIKPLLRGDISKILYPLRHYMQTVGLACDVKSFENFSRVFRSVGATRVNSLEYMLGAGYMGEPHDGVYALIRYSKKISYHINDTARGIANFQEFKLGKRDTQIPNVLIMNKQDFQRIKVEDKYAEFFVNSSGSSGKPKISVFTYDDYHYAMRNAAEGLYAAGLDPSTDKCMNLFVCGRMYGSFVSFFTILEYLKCPQFPVTQHTNFDEIIDTIINNRVNVLMGVTSFLMQLFECGKKRLADYHGITKVFYAGEHITEKQRQLLKSKFKVKLIKSAAYGSNEIGPMGYQCKYCMGSVFHLHTKLQKLEILDREKDIPVSGSEIGRLIFTPLDRKGQCIQRYEIGDLGRWVRKPCACARTEPRFELLGRYGDVFRPGSAPLMNYWKFVDILSKKAHYTGHIQIEYGFKINKREGLIVYISKKSGIDRGLARDLIINNYKELKQFTIDVPLVEFQVKRVDPDKFKRASRSGKIINVINREKR